MICPRCKTENSETKNFCHECGAKLVMYCPHCNTEILPADKFCGECGLKLKESEPQTKELADIKSEGERKHITVLFSDLVGYTSMSEGLDPEEVKEIMSHIFDRISQTIYKYEGFIDKFIGDAVMALFGVPRAHEDDPVRAIKAAKEIHYRVEAMSLKIAKKIGKPFAMHTGINTGLVVTGDIEYDKLFGSVTGDTVNLASRLKDLAKPGEILVGPKTYQQAEGYFTFKDLDPVRVKGKAEPLPVYRVLSQKKRPVKIHHLFDLKAHLIGRNTELTQLIEATEKVKQGKNIIISVCGDAGTGKSRLIEEYKSTLATQEIQWLEGHAHAHCQNIPYFPMIDMLNLVWGIDESDPPDRLRIKIESSIERLIEKKENIIPYVGSLYNLSYNDLGCK
jgi:class 3 adenylate cyclase